MLLRSTVCKLSVLRLEQPLRVVLASYLCAGACAQPLYNNKLICNCLRS